jgi:two-component system, OmpR family, KDP operon response regulator KdpE
VSEDRLVRTRALVVDDEQPIRRALELTLSRAGYDVRTAATAREALVAAALDPPDIVLLDLVLPDDDGVSVCRELRSWTAVPILLLSAVDDEREKVRALDAGADDYITKPFGVDELLARVRALLRRAEGATGDDRQVATFGGVSVDLVRHVAAAGGRELHLTPTEFRLLRELVRARGRLLTHQMLLKQAWGAGYADDTAVLRVHIARLRDKLEAAALPRETVQTVLGVGYRMHEGPPVTDP